MFSIRHDGSSIPCNRWPQSGRSTVVNRGVVSTDKPPPTWFEDLPAGHFKLAMSTGDNRHYVVERIMPRHFVQHADAAGLPAGTMDAVLAEYVEAAPGAIEAARAAMPGDCPAVVIESIVSGFNARMRLPCWARRPASQGRRSGAGLLSLHRSTGFSLIRVTARSGLMPLSVRQSCAFAPPRRH